MNTGAGDTTIDLAGDHGGRFDAVIHNGVGDLTLRLPQESNTRILLHQGVGDIDTSGIVDKDDYYITAVFNPSLPANEITMARCRFYPVGGSMSDNTEKKLCRETVTIAAFLGLFCTMIIFVARLIHLPLRSLNIKSRHPC